MFFISFPRSLTVLVLPVRAGIDKTATSLFVSESIDFLLNDHLCLNRFRLLEDLDELALFDLSKQTFGYTQKEDNLSHRMKSMHVRNMFVSSCCVTSGYSKKTGEYISGDKGDFSCDVEVLALLIGDIGARLVSDMVDRLLLVTAVQRYESFFFTPPRLIFKVRAFA